MFTDWTTQESDPHVIVHQFFGPRRLGQDNGVQLDTPSLDAPIDKSGSLVWHFLQSGHKAQIYRTADGGYSSGYLHTIWNVQPTPGTGTYSFGIYCYANQLDLVHGSGQCYELGFRLRLGEYEVHITKSNTGITYVQSLDPPFKELILSSTGAWAPLTSFTTEFKWVKTPNSIILTYSKGSIISPNPFTDLVPILEYEDTDSPLTSTIGQGFYANSNTWNRVTYFMDIAEGRVLPDVT